MSSSGAVRSSIAFCRASASTFLARLGLREFTVLGEDAGPSNATIGCAFNVANSSWSQNSGPEGVVLELNGGTILPASSAERPLQVQSKGVFQTCICLQPLSTLWQQTGSRSLSTNIEVDVREKVDSINSKFAEAREEIEMAMEAKETVFFNEEALAAKKVVEEVLGEYSSLLSQVDEQKRGEIQRSMGLKMEQLKAEAAQLDDASS